MASRNILLVAGLFLVVMLAGCVDQSDPVAPVDGEDHQDDTTPSDETGDGPAPEPPPATAWKTQSVDGSVTGSDALVMNLIFTGENFVMEFTIDEDTTALYINLTSGGSELAIGIDDPDCDPGDTSTICDSEGTDNGELTHRIDDPSPGDWIVYVGPGEPLVVDEPFHLEASWSFQGE